MSDADAYALWRELDQMGMTDDAAVGIIQRAFEDAIAKALREKSEWSGLDERDQGV